MRWDVLSTGARASCDPADAAELTDEAALLEAAGIAVHAVPGEAANLKITRPDDLALAEARLAGIGLTRTGFGSDRHPFGPGDGLRLGGVEIAGAPRLHGHSDGDAALHAIAGALLGAVALGDLGGLHPADARTPRGIASTDLLASVRDALAAEGWRPMAVDLSIHAGRPWLADHLPGMRAAIAALLGLDVAAVSVKASTGNLSGDVGAGRVIEAEAIATVIRGAGGAMTLRLQDTLTGETRPLEPLEPATSGSTPAARPSTARPTSATSARSCSPTCSFATSATGACASPGS